MTFVYPWVLLALPFPGWLVLAARRRQPRILSPSLQLWPTERQGRARWLWLVPAGQIFGLLLLLVALARPQVGETRWVQVSQGIAIQLLADVSSSMGMNVRGRDGRDHTRMEVAKELIARFIAGDGRKLSGRENDLIGLVTFARYADTRSPLTFGHEALLQLVADLEIQDRPNEDGTAYGDALAIAAARLKQLDDPKIRRLRSLEGDIRSRVIILLTDGENNSGDHLPVEAAGLAKQWGCRIYSISLGDAADPLLRVANSPTQLTDSERVLRHISEQTGGVFRRAFDFDSLLAVYQEIDQLEPSRIVSRKYTRVAEWFWVPLAAALFLLLPAYLLEATWLRTVP